MVRFLVHTLLAVFALVAAGIAASANAQTAYEKEIAAAARELDGIERALASRDPDVRALEADLRRLIMESRQRLAPIESELAEVGDRLSILPPAPKEAETEPSDIAARRKALETERDELLVQQQSVLANIDEASRLLSDISADRLRRLYTGLVARGESLISPGLWTVGAVASATLGEKVVGYISGWASSRGDRQSVWISVVALLAALIISGLVVGPLHRWLRSRFAHRLEALTPTTGRRVAVAGLAMLARIASGVIGGLLVIETARAVGLLGDDGLAVARALWLAILGFLLIEGFTSGLFSTAAPAWRLAPFELAKGRRARNLILGVVAVVGAKTVLAEIGAAAEAEPRLLWLLDGASAVAVGVLILLLSRRGLWVIASESGHDAPLDAALADGERAAATVAQDARDVWARLRWVARLLAIMIIIAAVAGYVRLAEFAVLRLYYLGLVLAIAWFLRSALHEASFWLERRLSRRRPGAPDESSVVRFWIKTGVDGAILLSLAPAVLVIAGVGWGSVRDLALRAFLGFRIGNVTISLADILVAAAIFVGVLALTRGLRRGLEKGPLAHSRLDSGVQNSLSTLVGYLGLMIAAVAGVTALGVDLSNLAIIAGALSVGVGFGLQSIVNNFVSGLILLFERPVKVGDWIVTPSGEGTVRKISVRSTEIETFDRASIIIPNSELISSSVTNWTHKNALGRIIVPVGVDYGSDPEKVQEILLDCVRKHPLILRHPEPFVVWRDFGASSLDFDVRGFVADISKGLSVRTELRFAIFKALKAAGIAFPFPQQDVHIRSWPDQMGPPRFEEKP